VPGSIIWDDEATAVFSDGAKQLAFEIRVHAAKHEPDRFYLEGARRVGLLAIRRHQILIAPNECGGRHWRLRTGDPR